MLKIAVIGVIAALLAIVLKKEKPEIGLILVLAASVLIMSFSVDKLQEIILNIKKLEAYLGGNSIYLGILLKIIGITYIAEFGAGFCLDAGYSAIAKQVEFFGKLLILAVSMPILSALIQTIMNFW